MNQKRARNLGDSGFMVVRGEKLVLKTPEQQHDFNFPYQLDSTGKDKPEQAQKFELPVEKGDIIVLGKN